MLDMDRSSSVRGAVDHPPTLPKPRLRSLTGSSDKLEQPRGLQWHAPAFLQSQPVPSLPDLSRFRELFPITASRAYLFAGGLAPAAVQVRAAMDEWTDRWMFDPVYHRARYFEEWELLRSRLAQLLGADAEEVAIVDNTSRGSNLAIQMIPAPSGANVVIDQTSHPSAIYPWLLPQKAGVEIRQAQSNGPEAIDSAVDDRTVALIVSHVDPVSGFRHDLSRLADLVHAHGGFLLVDVAQSAGAVELDAQGMGIDFMSGTVMKWLLGPPGVGFFYARREHLENMLPGNVGYVGVDDPDASHRSGPLPFKPGAIRHEIGLASLPGIAAARQGLEIILEAGITAIEQHVIGLTDLMITELLARDIRVLTPEEPARRGGVVAFEAAQAVQLARHLRRRAVDVWGYSSDQRVRADPHLYNTAGDVRRLIDGIDDFMAREGAEAVLATGS